MKCFFCQYNTAPSYKDVGNIEKFLTPRRKIMSLEDSKLCAKHQRILASEVKKARYLGLLPYTLLQTHKIREIEEE